MAEFASVDAAINWKSIDDRTVQGTFTHSGHTIHAIPYFDDSGALVNFTSADRPGLAPDGKTFIPQRWSTPLSGYRANGAFRRASLGDAPTSGEFTYGEFNLQEIAYNVVQ